MTSERYQKGDLRGYIWWCGDEHCDCTQPIIERVAPAGLPSPRGAVHRERLWEGTFRSQASSEERSEQDWELAQAATEYGLEPIQRSSESETG